MTPVTIPAVDPDQIDDPELVRLAEWAGFARDYEEHLRHRDDKIRELGAAGYPVKLLAEAAQLKPARIYQILGPKRPRSREESPAES